LVTFLVLIGIIVLAIAVFIIWNFATAPKTDKEFLSQLKGEVVFTRRNSDSVSDIWKINANGTGEVMLFHNEKDKTRTSFPCWSLSGDKIYFFLYDLIKKEKQIYEMNTDGTDIKLAVNPDPKPEDFTQFSRKKDIKEFKGDLFITQNGQEVQIFKHSGYYDQDFAAGSGAREASWSPDRQYIIFEADGTVVVADKTGHLTKITAGGTPDWKY
ncbi:hypothetical protein KKA66_02985, partial [Patescibacteria group bacterium]|nr:hypothetical protein [Patescibacteria group bacterium]